MEPEGQAMIDLTPDNTPLPDERVLAILHEIVNYNRLTYALDSGLLGDHEDTAVYMLEAGLLHRDDIDAKDGEP